MVSYAKQVLTSYGMHTATSQVCIPECYEDVITCIKYASESNLKICPAGSRLSFSNVCLINNQISIDLRKLNRLLAYNHEHATVTVQAGMLTSTLLEYILPLGYCLTGLTGSLGNTIGGDISNDVNGKDSWKSGNFGQNVIELKLVTADGNIVRVNRTENEAEFNAVVGGLGLVGVIIEVSLKLHPINSFMLKCTSLKLRNVGELIDAMNKLDSDDTDFAYCWTDPFAPLSSLGRGICEKATFIKTDKKFNASEIAEQLKEKKRIGPFKPETFWWLFRKIDYPVAYQWAGYLKYALPTGKSRELPFHKYQYPMLKYFPKWNLKYYPKGFCEWQILIPSENFEKAYTDILSFCQNQGFTPYVCAVRKHRKQSPYLSFSGNGFSMTVNYGLNDHSMQQRQKFEGELIIKVLQYKGKVYLGKYPFFNKSFLREMYPELNSFLKVKQTMDANNLFWSDAAQRLLANR